MLRFSLIAAMTLLVQSCGVNLFEYLVVDKTSEAVQLEEAKTLIDEREYEEALHLLDQMKDDSNERRILITAGRLGASGLDVWKILRDLLSSDSSVAGMDDFFDSVSETLFGVDEVKTTRILAIRTALTELSTAPEPEKARIRDLSCMLAGMWTVPTVQSATTAMTAMQTSLSSITLNDCSGIDALDAALSDVSTLAADFQSILGALSGCSILTVGGSADSLNAVEQQLTTLTDNADGGCEVPTCAAGDTICQILNMSCVNEKFADDTAAEGDGTITSCELVQNCYDPTLCFDL